MQTVNMARHTIHVTDNASCKATKQVLKDFSTYIQLYTNGQNLGTAKAVNIGWAYIGIGCLINTVVNLPSNCIVAINMFM